MFVGGQHKGSGRASRGDFLIFFRWFPWEKHLDRPPPCSFGFVWVLVGLRASCGHSPSRACSTLLLQGSGWEAGGTTVCRIAHSWPGNFIIKAHWLSKKKLSCFVGWIPRASVAAWGVKTPSFYSPVSVFLWKSGLLVNHTLISVFYSLGARAY